MVIELIVFIETDGTVLATLELTFFGWWSNRLRVDGRNRCHSPPPRLNCCVHSNTPRASYLRNTPPADIPDPINVPTRLWCHKWLGSHRCLGRVDTVSMSLG